MRVVLVGLGIQGKKRAAVARDEVVATVDPVAPAAQYRSIEQVPHEAYDAALVCVPDQAKLDVLEYLLARGRHVLVEKPLLAKDARQLRLLAELARANRAACYTAYNHRFEPHIRHLKEVLDQKTLGNLYLARFFYGNGTARDVKGSAWRDQGSGVLADLGSHLLDMVLFLFGARETNFRLWSFHRFENRACDHFCMGSDGQPAVELEGTLLSWRNTFTVDLFGELGSAHIDCLCKWGASTFTVRTRVFPSGRPSEQVQRLESADPTWALEYEHFKRLCRTGGTNLENDIWINAALSALADQAGEEAHA